VADNPKRDATLEIYCYENILIVSHTPGRRDGIRLQIFFENSPEERSSVLGRAARSLRPRFNFRTGPIFSYRHQDSRAGRG